MTSQDVNLHGLTPGGWLPRSRKAIDNWTDGVLRRIDDRHNQAGRPSFFSGMPLDDLPPLAPAIEEFRSAIESDAIMYMYFTKMWEEAQAKVKNYDMMLEFLNEILTTAPEFKVSDNPDEDENIVAVPVYALFMPVMNTPSGAAAFHNVKVNEQLQKLLEHWKNFLQGSDSARTLDTWLSPAALKKLSSESDFASVFECDRNATHWGFKSWDDFFTRKFRENMRPIAAPDDENIINNACESTPYHLARNVGKLEKFWTKGKLYSVKHMLANGPEYPEFIGGTVYQALLSAFNYHRWHSPVRGTVQRTELVPGTYYCFPNPADPTESQDYIAPHAARALMFIKADNEKIGLMCVIAVGMAEVSSCEIKVKKGDKVEKGDELGMFHFGGSSHCMLFRPGVVLEGLSPFRSPPRAMPNMPAEGFDTQGQALIKVNAGLFKVTS